LGAYSIFKNRLPIQLKDGFIDKSFQTFNSQNHFGTQFFHSVYQKFKIANHLNRLERQIQDSRHPKSSVSANSTTRASKSER
jgi:hypothetical protein